MEAQAGEVDVPRVQSGPNPQHLLSTVLGEYLDSADAELPAATVVAVLGEFGISPASARAALSRLTRRGIVAARGAPGRRCTASPRRRSRGTGRRCTASSRSGRSRGRGTGPGWGSRTRSRSPRQAQRHAVRKRLGELGFVRLYDSTWISPDRDAGPVRGAMGEILGGVPGARWSVLHVRFDDEAGPTARRPPTT